MQFGWPAQQKNQKMVFVKCKSCGCKTQTIYQKAYQAWEDCKQYAAEAWNRRLNNVPAVDAIPVDWFIRMNFSCGMQGEIGAVAALNWVLDQWKMTKEEWDNGLEVKNESCGLL